MEMRLNEKQQLLEQLHMLEDAERRGVLKMAKESPAEFNIFQENLNNITRLARALRDGLKSHSIYS
jgi:hypothetical protein